MRVALLGAGTIARLVLEQVRGGEVPGVEIVALAGIAAVLVALSALRFRKKLG